jgi:hypothetical protein
LGRRSAEVRVDRGGRRRTRGAAYARGPRRKFADPHRCRHFLIPSRQCLGLTVVIVFGLAALYCFTFSVLAAWSVLAAAVALDLIVYALIGRVTTCYACRAEYRKCPLNPAHEGFDLATSEKY